MFDPARDENEWIDRPLGGPMMQTQSKLPNATSTRLQPALVNPALHEPLAAGDALEVHELIHRVLLAEDSRDYDALRQLFTEDAVHDHSIYGRVQGSQAIVAFVQANLARGFDGVRHHAFNVVTARLGEDGAAAVSYVVPLKLFPAAGESDGDLPRILGHGVVRDRLIKRNARWRIAHRSYDQFSVWPEMLGDPEVLARAAQAVD